jgi:hypothetical protein
MITQAMTIGIPEVPFGIKQRDDICMSWVLPGQSVYSIATSSVFFVVSSIWFVSQTSWPKVLQLMMTLIRGRTDCNQGSASAHTDIAFGNYML